MGVEEEGEREGEEEREREGEEKEKREHGDDREKVCVSQSVYLRRTRVCVRLSCVCECVRRIKTVSQDAIENRTLLLWGGEGPRFRIDVGFEERLRCSSLTTLSWARRRAAFLISSSRSRFFLLLSLADRAALAILLWAEWRFSMSTEQEAECVLQNLPPATQGREHWAPRFVRH